MAVQVSNGAKNLTDASNVFTAKSVNNGWFSATFLALTSVRTLTLSLDATTHGLSGIIIGLNSQGLGAMDRTVQAVVKKNGAVQGTFTIASSTILHGVANSYGSYFVPITWTTITGVDNTATWTIEFSQTGGTTGTWSIITSNGTAISHCEITDITANLATNDCLFDKDGMTANSAFSLRGILGTGETVYAPALIVCESASAPTTSNSVGFKHLGKTLSIDGGILLGAHSAWRGGSSGTPTTDGWLSFATTPTNGTKVGIWDQMIESTAQDSQKMSFICYGTIPTKEFCYLAVTANVGATSITVDDASWLSIGDKIIIGKANVKGSADSTIYTISNIVGNVLTIPALAGSQRMASTTAQPAIVARMNGYGYKITGTATTTAVNRMTNPSNFILSGCELGYTTFQLARTTGQPTDDNGNMSAYVTTHCSSYGTGAGTALINTVNVPLDGYNVTYCNFGNKFALQNGKGTVGVLLYDHNFAQTTDSSAGVYFSAGDICTNNVFNNYQRNASGIIGVGVTFQNNHFYGCSNVQGGALYIAPCISPKAWGGNYFDYCVSSISNNSNSVNVNSSGDYFGSETANTQDIDFNSAGALFQGIFNSVSAFVFSSTSSTDLASADKNSYLILQNYAGVQGDDRTYKPLGKFTTDSPSYTNLRETVNQSTSFLSHQFQLLSQTIASKQFYLVVTGKINNAAYYGGTYAVPKIDIYTDGSSSVNQTLSLAANTSAQTIAQAFTPSTSNNPIVLDFQTKTDATGSNADVLWSNAQIVQRIYGYTYTVNNLNISETLTYPITTVTTPVANPFITQSNQATVHAYSGIAYSAGTLTISGNLTRQQVYDWVQDYLSLNPTVASFFDTIDGVNYTVGCNVTINTGIALTGGGSINISTNTWSNSGTYDGIVITSTNRIVHVQLQGIVAGSQYFISKQSDNSSVFNATCSGNTDDLYTYTTDLPVYVTIRQPGYVTIDKQMATITSTGLTLNISQQTDGTF